MKTLSGFFFAFNIVNLTERDLVVGMSWTASATTTNNPGNDIDAYEFRDMRLLLTDAPYLNIIDSADGAGAETFILTNATLDGEYYLVADFYDAMCEIPAALDITPNFWSSWNH